MSKRRRVLIAGAAIFGAPLFAGGQQAAKIHRIGFLETGSSTTNKWRFEVFMQQLGELGHVEGKTFTIAYRSAESKYERLPDLLAELIQRNVHVIVTAGGTNAALAAKKATGTIPVVFVGVADPVGQGIVASLARPGGNITGLSDQHTETATKTLQFLRETVPSATRIAILVNPANPSLPLVVKEMEGAARRLRVDTSLVYANAPGDFENAFGEVLRLRAAGFIILADAMFNANAAPLTALAMQHRLPTIGGVNAYAESGGLMSYGPDRPLQYRRAAVYVDKILKGVKPAELPVEQPTKFHLIVNLKTAKALGVSVPPSVSVLADQVLQ